MQEFYALIIVKRSMSQRYQCDPKEEFLEYRTEVSRKESLCSTQRVELQENAGFAADVSFGDGISEIKGVVFMN